MLIKGRIHGNTLARLLRALDLVSISGALTLVRQEVQALLVLRKGRLVSLVTSAANETIGNVLVFEGVIPAAVLEQAVAMQIDDQEPRRLAAILVEQGLADRDRVTAALRSHLKRHLEEILRWRDGIYRFEQLHVPDDAGLYFSLVELLEEIGLPEGDDDPSDVVYESELDSEWQQVFDKTPVSSTHALHAASLRLLMQQVRHVSFGAELTTQLLGYASRFVDRVIIVLPRRDGFQGIAQCGLEPEGAAANEAVRALKLPIHERSIFREVFESATLVRGPLAATPANRLLVRRLGGQVPVEAVALPLVVDNKVAMIVYGDILTPRPLEAIELLEAAIIQAGLALERSVLSQRVRQLEQKLEALEAERVQPGGAR